MKTQRRNSCWEKWTNSCTSVLNQS